MKSIKGSRIQGCKRPLGLGAFILCVKAGRSGHYVTINEGLARSPGSRQFCTTTSRKIFQLNQCIVAPDVCNPFDHLTSATRMNVIPQRPRKTGVRCKIEKNSRCQISCRDKVVRNVIIVVCSTTGMQNPHPYSNPQPLSTIHCISKKGKYRR